MSVPKRECQTCKYWVRVAEFGDCTHSEIKEKIGAWDVRESLITDADFGCNLW